MAKTSIKRKVVVKRRPTPGKGQNIWDDRQRLVVRLLLVDFQLEGKVACSVFNEIFKDHLASCGVRNGISVLALKGQYYDRFRKGVAAQWQSICGDATKPEEVTKRNALRGKIHRVLASLESDNGNIPSAPIQPTSSAFLKSELPPAQQLRSLSQVKPSVTNIDEEHERPAAKTTKQSPVQAMVVITRVEQEVARLNLTDTGLITPPKSPKTPSKSIKRSRSSSRPLHATISYELPSGARFLLTPEEYRETQEDLNPIAEAAAHPYVPLLFRYSTPTCQSPLTANGFLAGRFRTTIIPPPAPPTLDSFPWSDASQHLDRDQQIASPFISTSNSFIWVLRLALKEHMRGVKGGLITVIDPRKLDQRSVFHAQPLHKELCKKRPFSNGAHFYQGMGEFIVWAKIKKEALISTFPVEMIFDLANTHSGVGGVLRLEQLGQVRTGYHSTLLPAFKKAKIMLDSEAITAIAQVCKTIGLNVCSVEAVSSLVTDIIQRYGITLVSKTAEEWRSAASVFSKEMSKASGTTTLADMENMRYAFLDGCRWANGEFNSRQKPKHVQIMLNRAKKIGLESPAQILKWELDNAAVSIESHDKRQQALLRGSASRALLAGADEEDDLIMPGVEQDRKCLANDMEYLDYDSDDSCYEI